MTARPPKPTPRERLLAHVGGDPKRPFQRRFRRLLRAHERELAKRAGWTCQLREDVASVLSGMKCALDYSDDDGMKESVGRVEAAILGPPRKGGKP